MKRKSILILITRKLPEKIEKKLKEDFKVITNKTDKKLSYNELKKKISDVDILIPCVSDTIDGSIIKSGKKLKLIANFGNGVDNLDLVTAKEENVLVATGGGSVLRERNRENLKIRGLVIYLNADLTLLVKRTKDDTKRPLLKGKNIKKVLEKILRDRGSLYKEVSDIEINVAEKSSKNTVAKIIETLEKEVEIGKS